MRLGKGNKCSNSKGMTQLRTKGNSEWLVDSNGGKGER